MMNTIIILKIDEIGTMLLLMCFGVCFILQDFIPRRTRKVTLVWPNLATSNFYSYWMVTNLYFGNIK